jgi:hypothetical protein
LARESTEGDFTMRERAFPVHPLLIVVIAALAYATAAVGDQPEAAFLAANGAAMNRMMTAMSIAPTGDVDADFVAMMVPHHEGAIEMAVAELRYGRNEQLRRLAQEIIVTQRDEIAAMRLALGQSPAPTPRAPDSQAPSPAGTSDTPR